MSRQVSVFHVTLAEQARDRYPQVDFDIPPGTESLEVRIDFDGRDSGIDLGCEGPAGWRGWSGGARRGYVIAADTATPGYLPGPLEPGRWSVVLGLHRLPAEGTDITVAVQLSTSERPELEPVGEPAFRPARGSERDLPAPPGLTWFAGDFHSHSTHSDGSSSLSQLVSLGVEAGLDFMAVTEHNTTSHHRLLPALADRYEITLVPGQEVTTHQGHANAFGDIGFVDFRQPADEWVRCVAERGGVLSVNHPVSGDCSWTHRTTTRPSCVELFHSDWYDELISTAPLAWFEGWDRSAVLIGGSDFHNTSEGYRPGCPTTWVAAEENGVDGILDAVRAGRTAVSGARVPSGRLLSPDVASGPVLLRIGNELVAVDAEGTFLVDGAGHREPVTTRQHRFVAARDAGPFRLVAADRSMLALSA